MGLPLSGVHAAADFILLILSWEVAVVAPTAAVRRLAGFHLARHYAMDRGIWHRILQWIGAGTARGFALDHGNPTSGLPH